MKKFKTTFVAELYDMIQEDLSAMEELNSTYKNALKCDTDAQTIVWQLLVEKLVAKNLVKLYNDIHDYKSKFMNSNAKEYEKNFKSSGLDKYCTYDEFEPVGEGENVSWEKGYLAWLEDGFNSVASIIKGDEDKLLSLIKY